jgi:DNA mismatch repair protein MutS2
LARLLRLLETRVDELTQRESEVRSERDRMEAERKSLNEIWDRRESQKLTELERRNEAMLEEFRKRAEETIERLAEGGEQRKMAAKGAQRVAQIKREFREEFAATVRTAQRQSESGTLDQEELPIQVGSRVRLKGVREPARVRRMLGEDRIEVEAGFIKLQMERGDVIEVLPDTPEGAKLPANVTFRGTEAPLVSFRELNLIGKRAEESRDELEKFLDQAALAGLSRVRIVHGHGMGILKKLVREMLKESQHVAKFYEAPPTEGGAGATVAEMREG